MPAPTRDDILDIARRVYRRTRELFASLGRDWEKPEEMDEQVVTGATQEPLLFECAQASLKGVGLLGEQAGQRVLPLTAELHIPADLKHREQTGGFDLQATRRVSAGDRAGLARMCRYLLHPPLSHDRLSITHDGRVRLAFARPWRNQVDSSASAGRERPCEEGSDSERNTQTPHARRLSPFRRQPSRWTIVIVATSAEWYRNSQ